MPNASIEVTAGADNLQAYVDNGDGTVTDDVTKLVWQQMTPSKDHTQPEALAYCASLRLGGHDDWRLPALIELISIVDTGTYDPSIDAAMFPGTPAVGFYWSSTVYVGLPGNAWGSSSTTGTPRMKVCRRRTPYGACDERLAGAAVFVMKKPLGSLIVGAAVAAVALLTAVTGRGAAPAGRYTIAGGTVHDTRTKLTWQQMVPAAMYNQAEASSYCVSLALSGRTWRLPTMREILTIVDLTVGLPGPTIDTTAFPDTPAGFFWTSTQYSGTPTNYWSANFQYGFAYGNTLSDTSYVRCVSFARPASSAGR